MSDNKRIDPELNELIESIKQVFKDLEYLIGGYERLNKPVASITFLFEKLDAYRLKVPFRYLKAFNTHYYNYSSQYKNASAPQNVCQPQLVARQKNVNIDEINGVTSAISKHSSKTERNPGQFKRSEPKPIGISQSQGDNFSYYSQEDIRFHRESKFDPFRLRRLKRI